MGELYTYPRWGAVQKELEQLSSDNSIAGILQRQQEALVGLMLDKFPLVDRDVDEKTHEGTGDAAPPQEPPDPAEVAARKARQKDLQKDRENNERSLAAELAAAEEEFRARVAEITAQLPEAAKAAEKIPHDSPAALTAARIARIVGRADLPRLGPYWMLIVL